MSDTTTNVSPVEHEAVAQAKARRLDVETQGLKIQNEAQEHRRQLGLAAERELSSQAISAIGEHHVKLANAEKIQEETRHTEAFNRTREADFVKVNERDQLRKQAELERDLAKPEFDPKVRELDLKIGGDLF